MLEFVSVINTDQFLLECHKTYVYLSSFSVTGDYLYIPVFIYTAVSLHILIGMVLGFGAAFPKLLSINVFGLSDLSKIQDFCKLSL
jgi:hypothetical protein